MAEKKTSLIHLNSFLRSTLKIFRKRVQKWIQIFNDTYCSPLKIIRTLHYEHYAVIKLTFFNMTYQAKISLKLDVRYFPKVKFPNWKLPNCAISQAATKSILAASHGPQPFLVAALGHHCSLRRLRRPNLTFVKQLLGKLPFGK